MPLKVYKGFGPTLDFWGKRFKNLPLRKVNTLLSSCIEKYIQKGPILDAGCGQGYLVAYLSAKGYDSVGIDISKPAITSCNLALLKHIQLEIGDMKNLSFGDRVFSAYISEGVFEHFEEGPLQLFLEARRVLEKGGILIVSVPYYNLFRKSRRIFLRRYHYRGYSGETFFEYMYSQKDLQALLDSASFKTIKMIPASTFQTFQLDIFGESFPLPKVFRSFLSEISGEISYEKKAVNKGYALNRAMSKISTSIINTRVFKELFAHMIVVIAENP